MTRPWPRTLAGQLVLLLLAALLVAQVASFLIFRDERRAAFVTYGREQVLRRTVTVVRLLRETPPQLHGRILRAASGGNLRFDLAPQPVVTDTPEHRGNPLARALARRLDRDGVGRVLVDVARTGGVRIPGWRRGSFNEDAGEEEDEGHREREARRDTERRSGHGHEHRRFTLALAIDLGNGRWLVARTGPLAPPPGWAGPYLVALGLTALFVSLAAVWAVRRLTRPLSALAEAADAFGRGLDGPRLAATGPSEIRRTVQAFELMRERLRRFVEDRTRMLAAIGHDLRTPLTSLRLRAEFVEDEETRQKIVETLDEMQRMVEAALAFLREEAASEPAREVELRALVESVVSDFADLGGEVDIADGPPVTLRCRPDSLRRAVRNLVGNAMRYGRRARVRIDSSPADVRILVEDEGPGIPSEMLERVFEPFVRVEGSRSRETGGIGLGLAIARTIARSHGGDVRLGNRPQGGLRAELLLPR